MCRVFVYIMIFFKAAVCTDDLTIREEDEIKDARSETNDENELLRGSLHAIITGTYEHIRRRLLIILQVEEMTV